MTVSKIKPIHPFAARMASEIAFQALENLPKGSLVLDPMVGSGTVLRTISELGYQGIGVDVDPLAILMSTAWTTKIDEDTFLKKKEIIYNKALNARPEEIYLPWIDDHKPTSEFIKFWFGANQILALRSLSYFVNKDKSIYGPLLKVALSKLIIRKSNGASLASDVSHSRPHKVKEISEFDVFGEFSKMCSSLSKELLSEKLKGNITTKLGDARRLRIKPSSVDCIITSPPYLNALDYMRGHKLALVWLGHNIDTLSMIRSGSVGAEKAPELSANIKLAQKITASQKEITTLENRKINMIYRYALDMERVMSQASKVLKANHNATFVIGNSSIKGVYVNNTQIAIEAAHSHGLKIIHNFEREIPENKRYLPPPKKTDGSSFGLRMRTENVVTFKKMS